MFVTFRVSKLLRSRPINALQPLNMPHIVVTLAVLKEPLISMVNNPEHPWNIAFMYFTLAVLSFVR